MTPNEPQGPSLPNPEAEQDNRAEVPNGHAPLQVEKLEGRQESGRDEQDEAEEDEAAE